MIEPRGLRLLLALGAISISLVTGAFFSAPDLDERSAMERRETLERARQLSVKGDATAAVAMLEPLLASGAPDRATARAMLAAYAASDRMFEHARLVLGPSGVMNILRAQDLHQIASLYIDRGMSKEAKVIAEVLDAKGAATPAELTVLGLAKLESGDTDGALAFARRIAPRIAKNSDRAAAAFVASQLARDGAPDEVEIFLSRWMGTKPLLPVLLSVSNDLVANGRADYVVTALADRQMESDSARNTYAFAVSRQALEGGEARTRLTHALIARLNTAKRGKQFDHALSDTLAFGDLDIVAEEFGRTGLWRVPAIRPAFVYALQNQGHKDKLRELLVAEAASAASEPQRQRALASELVSIGYTSDGIEVLKRAAVKEGPGGEALKDLLYTWRSSGVAAETGWMGDQARVADGADAEGWISVIAQASPEAAIREIELTEMIGNLSPAAASHLGVLKARYLAWAGDSPALRATLAQTSGAALSAADYAELGNIACQVGDTASAVRLASLLGGTRSASEIRDCAARLLVIDARKALAEDDKSRAGERFAEAWSFSGSALTAQDLSDWAHVAPPAEAAALYRSALELLPADEPLEIGARMLRAAILTELKRYREAQETLEIALATSPTNSRVRLMLAELYLGQKDYRRALALSESTQPLSGPS